MTMTLPRAIDDLAFAALSRDPEGYSTALLAAYDLATDLGDDAVAEPLTEFPAEPKTTDEWTWVIRAARALTNALAGNGHGA